jgi:hypothetical protein
MTSANFSNTQPFLPEQHAAVLQARTYRWGGLDVGGPRGFSALVIFREHGTRPHVELYFRATSANDMTATPNPRPPLDVAPASQNAAQWRRELVGFEKREDGAGQ